MTYESLGPTEVKQEVEKTPDQDLRDFLKTSMEDGASLVTENNKPELARWGAHLISGVTLRIGALRDKLGDDLDLDQFLLYAGGEAKKLDEQNRQIAIKNKTEPPKDSVEGQLVISWAGLLGELAVYDILDELTAEKKIVLLEGNNSEVTEKFDRYGADFVIIREDETIVGLQVKRHQGRSISVFNSLTAGRELKAEVAELISQGFIFSGREVIKDDSAFRSEARNFFGEDAKAILMYALVGKMAIDRKKGVFKGEEQERRDLKNSFLAVINGREPMAKIFDDRTKD